MTPQFLLKQHPIFSLADPAALSRAARATALRSHPAGVRVIRPQMPHTHVLVLVRGSLRLTQKNGAERTELLLGTVGAPAVFGDAELHAGLQRWGLHAQAAEDVTALWIENRAFEALVGSGPDVAYAMYRDASARHMLTVELMQVFGLQSLTNRLLRLLWTASSDDGSGGRHSALNQQELARALGVNRKTIARHLQRMEEVGLIARGARAVRILAAPRDAFADRPLARGLGARWELKRT